MKNLKCLIAFHLRDVNAMEVLALKRLQATILFLFRRQLSQALVRAALQIVELSNAPELRTDQTIHDHEVDGLLHHLKLHFVDSQQLGEQVSFVRDDVVVVVVKHAV